MAEEVYDPLQLAGFSVAGGVVYNWGVKRQPGNHFYIAEKGVTKMSTKIVRSLLLALAGVVALELHAEPEDAMFYIGETGYGSWMEAYGAADAGATITVGTNAVISQTNGNLVGVIGKSVTIDLAGHDLSYVQGWLTGCAVTIVDTGMPSVTGRFEMAAGRMNMSGGTLDLSALSGSQVSGNFQMSSTSLLKFPGDMDLDDCTSRIVIDTADTQSPKGKGARIVVKGVTYVYDGTGWVVAFKITSISVGDEVVEIGVMAPESGTVTIQGAESVNGEYHAVENASSTDGVLYRFPVSADRFFKATLDLEDI